MMALSVCKAWIQSTCRPALVSSPIPGLVAIVRSSTSTSSGVSGQLGGSQGIYANESAGTSKKVVIKSGEASTEKLTVLRQWDVSSSIIQVGEDLRGEGPMTLFQESEDVTVNAHVRYSGKWIHTTGVSGGDMFKALQPIHELTFNPHVVWGFRTLALQQNLVIVPIIRPKLCLLIDLCKEKVLQ